MHKGTFLFNGCENVIIGNFWYVQNKYVVVGHDSTHMKTQLVQRMFGHNDKIDQGHPQAHRKVMVSLSYRRRIHLPKEVYGYSDPS